MAKDTSYNAEGAPKEGEVYRHYKGDFYRVLFLAVHNDPDELCVIYEPVVKTDHGFDKYSRLLKSWNEEVEWNGEMVKRFTFIKDEI